MAKALDVARFLIHLAADDDEPELLTHLRLQKLLYYVQGWSLALRGKAMFPEQIQAWSHGPVVKDVYPSFAEYGSKPIPSEQIIGAEEIEEDEAELIGSVWEAYKGYTALGLRQKTHSETPWVEARGTLEAAARCETEITQKAMQDFFTTLANA